MPKFGDGIFSTVTVLDGAGHWLQLPKLTTTQRNALAAVNGMEVYNSTTKQVEVYANGAWKATGAEVVATHAALTALAGHAWGAFGINRLAGVLATQSGWDTAPTSLANATDGDWSTATGVAINTAVAAYTYGGGYILFDMGAVYSVLLRARILMGNTLAAGQLVLGGFESSPDNSNWDWLQPTYYDAAIQNYCANADVVSFWQGVTRDRHIRFRVKNDDTQTDLRLGLYEVEAIDMGL